MLGYDWIRRRRTSSFSEYQRSTNLSSSESQPANVMTPLFWIVALVPFVLLAGTLYDMRSKCPKGMEDEASCLDES